MPKDYYLILGLSRDADCHEIKQAYRNLAKKIHPDVTDCREKREKFLEIKEAYETLADETKRRRYDTQLSRRKSDGRNQAARPGSPPGHPGRTFFRRPPYPGSSPDPFEDFLNEFRGFPGSTPQAEELFFEAVLTGREAQTGGDFPLTLPVKVPCPQCAWSAFRRDPWCSVCGGRGTVSSETEFTLRIPPQVHDSARIRFVLDRAGTSRLFVTITIKIEY
ncbi:MAG: DnaJ domain-containing protein [Desulfohalobiaceae bacterium]|nr:DnaJ domain-containing protein [Desulfohalobiaceae bacterium]